MDDKRNENSVGVYRLWRRMARVQPDAKRGAGGHLLGGGEDRSSLDADEQGSCSRRARRDVAAREGRARFLVHRLDERHQPVVARTLYGWEKRIPTNNLWHHKSCGQCGNIPGYPSSVMWLMNKLQRPLTSDETDQNVVHWRGTITVPASATLSASPLFSCATSIRPDMSAKSQGLPSAPIIRSVHCGTSFGTTKEMRIFLTTRPSWSR